jgi:hypothetical protein
MESKARRFDVAPLTDDPMLATHNNGYSRNLQIAVWKMLRAGMPGQVILSTLGLTAYDLARLQTANTMALDPPSTSLDQRRSNEARSSGGRVAPLESSPSNP